MGPGQALAPGALAPGIEPEGSAALCPRELDPLERDYLRLNPLENPRWITQSRFKAVATSGVSPFGAAGVMRVSAGDAGGFLRYSSGRSGASSHPSTTGRGLWTALSLFTIGTKKPGEEEVIQGGVVAGARFRIPVQNPGSESRFRISVQNLAGARVSGLVGRGLLAPRPSGWSTGFLS